MLLRSVLLAVFVFASVALVACGGSDDDAAAPTVAKNAPTSSSGGGNIPAKLTTVMVGDNKFTPASLQVPVGATVTWDWTGSTGRHSVTGKFNGEDVNSPTLSGTGVYLFAFQKAGVFEYQCGIHGAAMKGTITIQ